MVAGGTFKYVVPRLKCHHSGCALVMTCQPWDNIFECSTFNPASLVQCIGLCGRHGMRWPKSKTKVLDFGLSPAQKLWFYTEFSFTFVLDQSLRLWSKPKILDCRVQNYCYHTSFAVTISDAYKDKINDDSVECENVDVIQTKTVRKFTAVKFALCENYQAQRQSRFIADLGSYQLSFPFVCIQLKIHQSQPNIYGFWL